VLTERAQCLLAVGDAAGARTLLEQYPAVFGTMSSWLTGLVDAAQDRLPRAKARVAALELPPAESPLWLRAAVAQVLVATGDRKRGAPLVVELRRAAPLDPSLAPLPPRF
jgi:hypothetical protein